MVKQYIGARYVPKFFENPDGSNDWLPNVQYEPITVVTFAGNSYTSKKNVPATAGNPTEASEYWASTGIYNAQIDVYREETARVRAAQGHIIDEDMPLNGTITEKVYSNTSNAVRVDTRLDVVDGGKLEDLTVVGDVLPTVFVSNGGKIEDCELDGNVSVTIAINHDTNGDKILHNKIEGENYPVLVDGTDGHDLLIDGNSIHSRNSDGVEVNTPQSSLEGTRIVNNYIKGDVGASADCLGIGMAKAENLIAANNVVTSFNKEGLHIEDGSKNVIVDGNIFTDCKQIGADISNVVGDEEYNIISDNIFESAPNSNYDGIVGAYSATTQVKKLGLFNTLIRGFKRAINMQGSDASIEVLNIDNVRIEDATTGIDTNRIISGRLFMENVSDIYVKSSGGSLIDEVITTDQVDVDKFLVSSGVVPSIIKKYSYRLPRGNGNINMAKVGRGIVGTYVVRATTNGNWYAPTVSYLVNVDTYNNTISAQTIGGYGALALSFSLANGYVVANTGSYSNVDILCHFDGYHIY